MSQSDSFCTISLASVTNVNNTLQAIVNITGRECANRVPMRLADRQTSERISVRNYLVARHAYLTGLGFTLFGNIMSRRSFGAAGFVAPGMAEELAAKPKFIAVKISHGHRSLGRGGRARERLAWKVFRGFRGRRRDRSRVGQ